MLLKGSTTTEIKNELDSTLKNPSSSFSRIKNGLLNLKVSTDDIATKIHNGTVHDRRLKLREFSCIANIVRDRLHNNLGENACVTAQQFQYLIFNHISL